MASRTALLIVAALTAVSGDAPSPHALPAPHAPPAPPATPARSDFDLLVIGAGPAGVEAACAAASYRLRVGLVERKARITGAPTGTHSKEMRYAALEGSRTWADVSSVIEATGSRAQASTEDRLRELGVVTLWGDATFENARTVSLATADGQRSVTAASVMIATGAHAFRPDDLSGAFDLAGVFDSDTITAIDYMPRSVVIEGGGPVGLEYAMVFAKLGAKVVILMHETQIVKDKDSSLREALLASLSDAGVEVFPSTTVDSVTEAAKNGSHSIAWQPLLNVQAGDHTLESDCFLYAGDTKGSLAGLGLENLQDIQLQKPYYTIVTDRRQMTGVDGIYAIGDAAGAGLATIAQEQALAAVYDLVSSRSGRLRVEASQTASPAGFWTIPSFAYAGLSEEDAAAQNLSFDAVRVGYNATVRGWISGESGFLKLVYSKSSGEVLGVHIFGETSLELVGYGAECINAGRTIFDILHHVLPAVTLSNLYHKAAEGAWAKSFMEQEAIV